MLFSPFIISLKYIISRRFGRYVGRSHHFYTGTKAQLYNLSEQGDSPPEELSYEDALLDAQLRLFMRADFDGVSPPSGQYAQVEQLILQDKEAEGSLLTLPSLPSPRPALQSPTSPFPTSQPSGRLYRLLMCTASVRLLPSGIALALLLMVLGANVSQLLRGEYVGVPPTPITEPQLPQAPTANPVAGQPEVYVFDPREVLMPKRPGASANPIYRYKILTDSLESRSE